MPPERRQLNWSSWKWFFLTIVVDIIIFAAMIVLYSPGDVATPALTENAAPLQPADNSSVDPADNTCLEPADQLRCFLCSPAVGCTLLCVAYTLLAVIAYVGVHHRDADPAPPNAAVAAAAHERGDRGGPGNAAQGNEAASVAHNAAQGNEAPSGAHNGGSEEISGRIKIEGESVTGSGSLEQTVRFPAAAAAAGGGGDRRNDYNWKLIAFTAMLLLDCINLAIIALDYIGDQLSLGPISLGTAAQREVISMAVQACSLVAAAVLYKLVHCGPGNPARLNSAAVGAHNRGENGEPSHSAQLDEPAVQIHGQNGCLGNPAQVMRPRGAHAAAE